MSTKIETAGILAGGIVRWTLREHGTYRIYDARRWHVAIGSAYICDGGHRPFVIDVWKGKGRGYIRPIGGPEFHITIPKLSFATAYRLRRFGLLHVYRVQSKLLRRIALKPKS